MRKSDITTHIKPDLDAALAVYIYVRHVLGVTLDRVRLHFVSAGQSGPGINLDTGCGCFDHHQPGRENVCAASLVWDFLPESDTRKALHELVKFVLMHDLTGSAFPKGSGVFLPNRPPANLPRFLKNIGTLQSIIGACHSCNKGDREVVEFMWRIFDTLYYSQLNRLKVEREYPQNAHWLTPHVVLLQCRSADFRQSLGIAFGLKAQAVIYDMTCPPNGSHRGGFGFGICCRTDSQVDLRQIDRQLFGKERWYFDKNGRLACHGSDKNPLPSKSKIKPMSLAQEFERLHSPLAKR